MLGLLTFPLYGAGWRALDLSRARAAYRAYAGSMLMPQGDEDSSTAEGTEDDAVVIDGEDADAVESDPIFKAINAITPAQREYFNSVVASMSSQPYESWQSLWAMPPDATCISAESFNAESFGLLPIYFYSPERKWSSKGLRTC